MSTGTFEQYVDLLRNRNTNKLLMILIFFLELQLFSFLELQWNRSLL